MTLKIIYFLKLNGHWGLWRSSVSPHVWTSGADSTTCDCPPEIESIQFFFLKESPFEFPESAWYCMSCIEGCPHSSKKNRFPPFSISVPQTFFLFCFWSLSVSLYNSTHNSCIQACNFLIQILVPHQYYLLKVCSGAINYLFVHVYFLVLFLFLNLSPVSLSNIYQILSLAYVTSWTVETWEINQSYMIPLGH